MMNLTLEQAISIRNDFRYIEGRVTPKKSTIRRVIVIPNDEENFTKFLESYLFNNGANRTDDDSLAQSLNPDSYSVHVMMNQISGVQFHGTLLEVLRELKIEIDIGRY